VVRDRDETVTFDFKSTIFSRLRRDRDRRFRVRDQDRDVQDRDRDIFETLHTNEL